MDVVIIYNGLGNQMSQYAFYLSKKLRGQKVRYVSFNTGHNGFELKKLFNIDEEKKLLKVIYLILWLRRWGIISNILTYVLDLVGIHFYDENSDYNFKKDALASNRGITFFIGGWHNPLYYDDYSDDIKKQYRFPEIEEEYNKNIITAINYNAVAIHVRGGDYMKGNLYNSYGAVCNKDYYKKAIRLVENKIENPIYYVFTNDVPLSEKILKGRNFTIVNNNTGVNAWKDMAIMSKFNTIIISNSTFSWWAAYLGDNKKTIICPTYLQQGNIKSDIFPKDWVRAEDITHLNSIITASDTK